MSTNRYEEQDRDDQGRFTASEIKCFMLGSRITANQLVYLNSRAEAANQTLSQQLYTEIMWGYFSNRVKPEQEEAAPHIYRITMRCTQEMVKTIKEMCERWDCTYSELVRLILSNPKE